MASTSHTMAACCASTLLRVRGLSVAYDGDRQANLALHQLDLDINRREIVGILGESGSGKSTLGLAMLGLLPSKARIEGSICFEDKDLLQADESAWRQVRGDKIAMIFQEPGLSLSPVMRIGDQVTEVIRAHHKGTKAQQKQAVEAALRESGFSDVDRIYRAYPYQLSGGELHRVVIAQALVCRPSLMIADEPTRSVDATLQVEVVKTLRDIQRKLGLGLIFITHNPALLAGFADRVVVMYAGRIVEQGPVEALFRKPLHPYTKGLLQLVSRTPPHSGYVRQERLPAIPGNLTGSDNWTRACAFEPRCFARTELCRRESPVEIETEGTRRVSCFNYGI